MSLNNLTTRTIPFAVVVAIFVAMAAGACGSDSASNGGEVGVVRVMDNDRIYVIDDLKNAP
ncbi:MAG: hypothetical protein GWP30_06730, partial [Actinobacteria bacterium]|nr:hypothetical protein [Actinomycetota bacterium]